MISYLKGNLEFILQDYIVIDVNGIGFQIFVSNYTISELPKLEDNLKIYTYMNVREDNVSLYGFLTRDEMNMFNILISVSGIGPKVALGILSSMRPHDISMAIIIEDIDTLTKAPGIGRKTAQRIVLDLKDKLKTNTAFKDDKINIDSVSKSSSSKQESIEALISLGYSQMEATKAVVDIYKDEMSTEDIIKLALKKVTKF